MSGAMELFSLQGRVAVVAGGLGLIGRALVEGLAGAGAHVVVADLNPAAAEDAAAALRSRGHNASAAELDIRDHRSIVECVRGVASAHGSLDVWVNSAYPKAAGGLSSLERVEPMLWREEVDAHLNGYAYCCGEAAAVMARAGHGSIINLSSIFGIIAPDFAIYDGLDMTTPPTYAAIKGGLISLTRYLASYYGPQGVRVNCVSPGGILNRQPDEFVRRYVRKTPLGRMGVPEDIAGAVVYLASDASSYVTGHNLVVDGGWTAL